MVSMENCNTHKKQYNDMFEQRTFYIYCLTFLWIFMKPEVILPIFRAA